MLFLLHLLTYSYDLALGHAWHSNALHDISSVTP